MKSLTLVFVLLILGSHAIESTEKVSTLTTLKKLAPQPDPIVSFLKTADDWEEQSVELSTDSNNPSASQQTITWNSRLSASSPLWQKLAIAAGLAWLIGVIASGVLVKLVRSRPHYLLRIGVPVFAFAAFAALLAVWVTAAVKKEIPNHVSEYKLKEWRDAHNGENPSNSSDFVTTDPSLSAAMDYNLGSVLGVVLAGIIDLLPVLDSMNFHESQAEVTWFRVLRVVVADFVSLSFTAVVLLNLTHFFDYHFPAAYVLFFFVLLYLSLGLKSQGSLAIIIRDKKAQLGTTIAASLMIVVVIIGMIVKNGYVVAVGEGIALAFVGAAIVLDFYQTLPRRSLPPPHQESIHSQQRKPKPPRRGSGDLVINEDY